MRDYPKYEQILLASVPHRFRYDIYNAVKAFERSEVLLHVYSCAAKALPWPQTLGDATFALVAFGSLGRLDGSPLTSDYDILHLYSGSKNDDVVKRIRQCITALISSNKALSFEHRDRIEAGKFEFGSSQAYQILSYRELLQEDHEIQALQLLTEGRIVQGDAGTNQLRESVAAKYGYTDNEHALDLTQLREALVRLTTTYGKGVVGRLAKENKTLLNRKILKLFALREFSYLSTLFALAETAIASTVSPLRPQEITRMLSAPCLVKLASFANPSSPLSQLAQCQSPQVATESAGIALRYVRNTLSQKDPEPGLVQSTRAPELVEELRTLVLAALGKYDALLHRLHDPYFLSLIDKYKPDVTTWISEKEFAKILDLRKELIRASAVLANCLGEIVGFINHRNQSPALVDARKSLLTISEYTLESDAIEIQGDAAEAPATVNG